MQQGIAPQGSQAIETEQRPDRCRHQTDRIIHRIRKKLKLFYHLTVVEFKIVEIWALSDRKMRGLIQAMVEHLLKEERMFSLTDFTIA